jgi:hypothetical protein
MGRRKKKEEKEEGRKKEEGGGEEKYWSFEVKVDSPWTSADMKRFWPLLISHFLTS